MLVARRFCSGPTNPPSAHLQAAANLGSVLLANELRGKVDVKSVRDSDTTERKPVTQRLKIVVCVCVSIDRFTVKH